jgi:hypothetical protein
MARRAGSHLPDCGRLTRLENADLSLGSQLQGVIGKGVWRLPHEARSLPEGMWADVAERAPVDGDGDSRLEPG